MTSLSAAVADARTRFQAAGLADAAIEARMLIGGLLQLSSTEVFVQGDRAIDAGEAEKIEAAILRRLKREPVHRILGRREFHGLDLKISPGTLEPRPDTEILVDSVIEHVRRLGLERPRILDLGTGTGAIALALLHALPGAIATGVDVSTDALETAARNAADHELADRFQPMRSNWFSELSDKFDIIVSNPPYIRSDVIPALDPEVRDFDPVAALDGGPDGLDAYRAIAQGSGAFLDDSGFIAVEIGFDQQNTVTGLFEETGFTLAQARRDYGGNDRVLMFVKSKP